MVVTDIGKSGLALLMAGSGTVPSFCGVGTGSASEVASLGSLITPFGARRTFTTRDISTIKEVEWNFDFDSISMSGCNLTEFGMGAVVGSGANDLWNRENFLSIQFDGTNELMISIVYKIF
jgi:hypothetical protein